MFMRLILFVFAVVSVGVQPALAEQSFAERLRVLEKEGKRQELFDTALSPNSEEEFVAALDFMKERIVAGAYDPGYHTSYAQLLWHADIKDTAATMAVAALLILYTDRARCTDETGGKTRIYNTFEVLKPMFEYTRLAEKKLHYQILNTASMMENRLDRRPPNRSLCYSGIVASGQAVKMIEDGLVMAEKDAQGNTLIPDIPSIEVGYIPDREWHAKRLDIRSHFNEYFE